MKQRIISGAQPSADSLHLGNYLGAVRNWVAMQETYESLFFIADLHAMTMGYDPKILAHRTRVTAAQYLAAGLDPNKTVLFVQSQVPEHAQLAWVLNCITGFGEAARMTQFKDKSAQDNQTQSSVGLFTYPILMAADILLYKPTLVPVGEDQKQHLELSRNLVQRFNKRFTNTFPVPEFYTMPSTAKIYDLQNPLAKMSKSAVNQTGVLNLLDEKKVNVKKIGSAVTDNGGEILFDVENKPGISNLLTIYSALTGQSIADVVVLYAGKGYGLFKKDLVEIVLNFVDPFRQRVLEFLADPAELDKILFAGAQKAKQIAAVTLGEVYKKVGLLKI